MSGMVALQQARGQALVEFALVLPVLLLMLLGAVEVGFLAVAKGHQDRATAVVAEWAAGHPGQSWSSIANRELTGCDVAVELEAPAHDLVIATSRCQYQGVTGLPMFGLIPISSREAAATDKGSGEPSATPDASPS